MEFMGLFAAVYVSDMDRGIDWYTRLIGRAPDHRPMPTLAQWVGLAGAGIQLFDDAAKAGKGTMTIVTPSIDSARKALADGNLTLSPEQRGDFGAVAGIEDPDGNRITLAEPPKRA